LKDKEAEALQREKAIREREETLVRARETLEQDVANKVRAERVRIAAEEAKKAKLELAGDMEQRALELRALQETLAQNNQKLAEAQKAQAALLKKERELDDAKRELELSIEKRVGESLNAVREKAGKEAEERLSLKVAEKEQTISAMQRQIEELRRKAEQGSQQLQGEVQELRLESLLKEQFPRDTIEPVAKGVHGGDVVQRVTTDSGRICGSILWESKRTKSWSDGWLAKLRDDQRAAHAEVAVIVTQVMPKEMEHFGLTEQVWVTGMHCVLPVAIALRHSLIELAAVRQSADGQQTKVELVYQYLTGPRFKHRVQAIVEKFQAMQEDLNTERKMMTKLWAKREQHINGVLETTAGLYGDLQGIAGKTLQEIEGLEPKLLDGE